jgi:hypothetical protein
MSTQTIQGRELMPQQVEVLMGAAIPKYATREGVQRYVAKTISHKLDGWAMMSERELAAICMMEEGDVSDMLKGAKPVRLDLITRAQFILELTADSYIPLNPNLPHQKYVDIYTQITGKSPDPNDATIRQQVGMFLLSHCLDN